MRVIYCLIVSVFIFTSCGEEEEIIIPKAETVIFIELDGINFNNIDKENSPNLDLIVRSGTEVMLNNPNSLNGFSLLNLSDDSSFIDIINKYLRSENNFYLNENSDSLNIFEEAANIFADREANFIYINSEMYTDSIQLFDNDFNTLLEKINYSAKFNKTLLVLIFNNGTEDNNELKIVVNGPKIRKGAEVEGIIEAIDLNTSILNAMEISVPEDWPGEKIKYLFLKEYRD